VDDFPEVTMTATESTSALPLRFYSDLARWWPLISPVGEYEAEAREFARLLTGAVRTVRTVLELGSGGGHNAFHLKRQFQLTLTDTSGEMLVLSQQLNPECAHVQGDMRALRLAQAFDAVFVHDAIDYMTTEADVAAVMRTAFAHCRPGGIALFVPDQTAETFAPSTDCGGHDAPDGRGVRYLEWSYDPDPSDTTITTEYAFLLRESDGSVSSVAETHLGGLFPRASWVGLVQQAGFRAEMAIERTDDDREPRTIFIGHRDPL
jgi:SAM-dependent methyltransferase